jgi:hypothetical protein
MISNSETNDLYEKMCQARREWEFASEGFRHAVQLSQGLEGNPDGVASLRFAVSREVEALKTYRAAVHAYAKDVKNSRRA